MSRWDQEQREQQVTHVIEIGPKLAEAIQSVVSILSASDRRIAAQVREVRETLESAVERNQPKGE